MSPSERLSFKPNPPIHRVLKLEYVLQTNAVWILHNDTYNSIGIPPFLRRNTACCTTARRLAQRSGPGRVNLQSSFTRGCHRTLPYLSPDLPVWRFPELSSSPVSALCVSGRSERGLCTGTTFSLPTSGLFPPLARRLCRKSALLAPAGRSSHS